MSEFKVGDRVRLICCRRYGTIIKEKEMFGTRPHYTVLFDYDETDCLVPEEDLEIVDEHGKTLLEQRIEKLEKEVFKPVVENNRPKETKPSLLTEDERVILRNLDKKWEWIARDNNGFLSLFDGYEPFKGDYEWKSDGTGLFLVAFSHLFQFIKWADKEPYNIEELLKGECGNE